MLFGILFGTLSEAVDVEKAELKRNAIRHLRWRKEEKSGRRIEFFF